MKRKSRKLPIIFILVVSVACLLAAAITSENRYVMKFDPSVVGGEKYTLSVQDATNEDLNAISEILKLRAAHSSLYGTEVSIEDGYLIFDAPYGSDIETILIKGELKGVIEQEIKLADGKGTLRIGAEPHSLSLNGEYLEYNNNTYLPGETLRIRGIDFQFLNSTNSSIFMHSIIFENDDLERISTMSSYARYENEFDIYQFSAPVYVSGDASNRFSNITEGLLSGVQLVGTPLNGVLIYYVDGEDIAKLAIPSDIAGVQIESISIIGGTDSLEEAQTKLAKLEFALAGVIDNDISVSGMEPFTGKYEYILDLIIILFVAAIFLVAGICYKFSKSGKTSLFLSSSLVLNVLPIFGLMSGLQLAFGKPIIGIYFLYGIVTFILINSYQLISNSKRMRYNKLARKADKMVKFIYILSFILIFTHFNGFGISMIMGFMMNFLTSKLYSDIE